MKKISMYIPVAVGLICMIAQQFVDVMGSLAGTILEGGMLLAFGVFFFLAGTIPGNKQKKRDWKLLSGGIIMGVLLFFLGGRILINAGIDMLKGPMPVALTDCSVSATTSLRRIFHSYYLEGTDMFGNKARFHIEKELFDTYAYDTDFSLNIICWENSSVIKMVQ